MSVWFKNKNTTKLVSIFILGAFIAMAFACTAMTKMDGGHVDDGVVCETITEFAGSTIVQTGFVILMMLGAILFFTNSKHSLSKSELNRRLLLFYQYPIEGLSISREHCYLCQLFSSGIIPSKLHTSY